MAQAIVYVPVFIPVFIPIFINNGSPSMNFIASPLQVDVHSSAPRATRITSPAFIAARVEQDEPNSDGLLPVVCDHIGIVPSMVKGNPLHPNEGRSPLVIGEDSLCFELTASEQKEKREKLGEVERNEEKEKEKDKEREKEEVKEEEEPIDSSLEATLSCHRFSPLVCGTQCFFGPYLFNMGGYNLQKWHFEVALSRQQNLSSSSSSSLSSRSSSILLSLKNCFKMALTCSTPSMDSDQMCFDMDLISSSSSLFFHLHHHHHHVTCTCLPPSWSLRYPQPYLLRYPYFVLSPWNNPVWVLKDNNSTPTATTTTTTTTTTAHFTTCGTSSSLPSLPGGRQRFGRRGSCSLDIQYSALFAFWQSYCRLFGASTSCGKSSRAFNTLSRFHKKFNSVLPLIITAPLKEVQQLSSGLELQLQHKPENEHIISSPENKGENETNNEEDNYDETDQQPQNRKPKRKKPKNKNKANGDNGGITSVNSTNCTILLSTQLITGSDLTDNNYNNTIYSDSDDDDDDYLLVFTGRPSFLVRPDFFLWGNNKNRFLFESYISNPRAGGVIVDNFEALVSKDIIKLSAGASKMLNTPNAGGNSVWSEVISYEVMHSTYGATLRRTEMEIEYWPESKITDYSVTVGGRHIGVSVTRAINFLDLTRKYKAPFTADDAHRLLAKKLFGVLASSQATVDKWEKQILHIWTTSKTSAKLVVKEYYNVEPSLRADTVVLVTFAKNADWLF